MDTSQRLKLVRGSLTQADFAQKIGVHKNSLGRYERGESTPDMDTIARICCVFDVSPQWLVLGEGEMYRLSPFAAVLERHDVPIRLSQSSASSARKAHAPYSDSPYSIDRPDIADRPAGRSSSTDRAAERPVDWPTERTDTSANNAPSVNKFCPLCLELRAELADERQERRELNAENRFLWKENSSLREKVAQLDALNRREIQARLDEAAHQVA